MLKQVIWTRPHDNNFISSSRSFITSMCVMDSLTRSYDDGLVSHAIFTDFAKAFNRVPHIPPAQTTIQWDIWPDAHSPPQFPYGSFSVFLNHPFPYWSASVLFLFSYFLSTSMALLVTFQRTLQCTLMVLQSEEPMLQNCN